MTIAGASRVAILYWGTRGGPVRQLSNLIDANLDAQIDLHFFLSTNIQGLRNLHSVIENRKHLAQLPKSKLGLIFRPFTKRKIINQTIEQMYSAEIKRVFFLLPHPWDIYLAKKLFKKTNIEIVRGVHDIKRHPGDVWPTKRAIRSCLTFAHRFVAFSPYIADALKGFNKPVELTSIYETKNRKSFPITDNSVLFVGRIRRYKGLDLLHEAWDLVENTEKRLTIAGEGQGIPFKTGTNVRVINEWLTDEKIEALIGAHQLVVLPYIEASQSGIIPIAHALGKPVVVTPVGGLSSQVIPNVNGIVTERVSAQSLAAAIDSALKMKWNIESTYVDLKSFLETIINYK
jgi:glycosyltransferase involved in cell wall biosynthesis